MKLRKLNEPQSTEVVDLNGVPVSVDGQAVESLIETWLLEDQWWTTKRMRRRMWELVTVKGTALIVYKDLETGDWWRSR